MKNNFGYLFSAIILTALFSFSFTKPETVLPKATSASILETAAPVKIQAHALNEDELKSVVSQEAAKQGYQVMVMTVENTTPYQYELKQDWVELDHAEKKKLLRNKKLSSLPRTIFYKIFGFFFWPVAIPDTIDTIITMKRNHSFKDKLHASLLKKEGEIVLPYSMIQRYLVINKEKLPKEFDLHLLNCRTQKHENYHIEIT
jgi:hypothetical protein